MIRDFLARDFLAHRVTFRDFMARNFLARDFLGWIQSTHMHVQLKEHGPLVHTHNVKSRLADCGIVLIAFHFSSCGYNQC